MTGLLFVSSLAFAGDEKHLLPATPITLHGTMTAYDAYRQVAKILNVTLWPVVPVTTSNGIPGEKWAKAYREVLIELKSASVALKLENATGAEAFEAISKGAHMSWETLPSSPRVLVVISASTSQDPPPTTRYF